MKATVIVRYGELALKSEPVRRRFLLKLIKSIKLSLRGINYKIRTERGRIFVDTGSATAVVKRLSKVPGIVSISPSQRANAEMSDIKALALRAAKGVLRPGMKFAVRTTRAGQHQFSSMDVNREVGAYILSAIRELRVDLSNPDREVSIEIRGDNAYVFTSTVKGVGGLPTGTQGNVLAIFSGTRKDVASAFMLLKRGCDVTPLYLNTRRGPNCSIPRQVISSVKKLTEFGCADNLWSFPFREILTALRKVPEGATFYICRRAALRSAEIVAKRIGADAIAIGDTGEDLVSQGLANLSAVDEACGLAVLRPLSGMNSREVRKIADRTGIKSFVRGDGPCMAPSGAKMSVEKLHIIENEAKMGGILSASSERIRVIRLR